MVSTHKPSYRAKLSELSRRARILMSRPSKGARSLMTHPEPQAIGSFQRGQQVLAGNIRIGAALIACAERQPWDVPAPSPAFAQALHGFEWLEDLAAVGGTEAREKAQAWVLDWIDRFGRGQGPGWAPSVTGRRLVRLITHAPMLLSHLKAAQQDAFFQSLSRQTLYLAREWQRGPTGLPRIEALTGLIYAGLTLEGLDEIRQRALDALAESVAKDVDPSGALASRNAEALLEVFTLLGWVQTVLEDVGQPVPDPIRAAMERTVPVLRALRHGNGTLARFHGCAGGKPGQLDKALVTSNIRTPATTGIAMGFETLHHGRSTIVIDASRPAQGIDSGAAHASTLAFEMTSGGHPLVVSCGPGTGFGPDWARAGRATASHSTLSLERYSSSRIGPEILSPEGLISPLVQTPRKVMAQKTTSRQGSAIILSHDGYARGQGLTHLRRLALSVDGRELAGEDSLRALSRADKVQFDRALDATALQGVPYQIRFHLHPEAQANLDLGGRAVSIALPSEEIWVFRPARDTEMTLEPSVFLEHNRLKPRATKQIVLSGRLVKYVATTNWTLTMAQDAHGVFPHRGRGRID